MTRYAWSIVSIKDVRKRPVKWAVHLHGNPWQWVASGLSDTIEEAEKVAAAECDRRNAQKGTA